MIGFLNLKKPSGITSHDLVNQVRKVTGLKQVGHGGTLDPLAQGVMILGLSKACRLIQYLPDDKSYKADILLGLRTDTDDIEGKTLESISDLSNIDEALVKDKLNSFKGKQIQIPPIYSAIKQGGKKLYELARKGEAPREIKGREIEIYSIEIISIQLPVLEVRIACSKGTYIRSIARDLGNQLGVGGCLKALVRETSGNFSIDNSVSIETLQEGQIENYLVSPQEALGLKTIAINMDIARRITNGQKVSLKELDCAPEHIEKKVFVSCEGKTLALMNKLEQESLSPEVVFIHASSL